MFGYFIENIVQENRKIQWGNVGKSNNDHTVIL